MRRAVIAVAAVLVLLPSMAQAGAKPTGITAQLDRTGPAATVTALRAKHKWDRVLQHIGTGKPAWLALAPRLAAGTDASASLGLTIALADALPRNPAGVLQIARGASGPLALSQVCSAPYVEPHAGDLASYRRNAKHAVSGINVPGLRTARSACLTALKDRAAARAA